jgi:hypothetical protein
MPSGGGVESGPPGVPGMAGAPIAPAGGFAGGGTLPPGWVSPGVQYAPPPMRQAYSTAQTQMALRRQLVPDPYGALSETARQRGAYSNAQLLAGLTDLQHAFADTASQDLLDVDTIKKRITSALIGDGAPEKMISGEASSAIEIVANLFSALLHDALVPKAAKSHRQNRAM